MKIALLGHGTVGRGVDQVISSSVPGVEVARILEVPDRIDDERMTSNFDDIADDESIELVVECMGGIEPAHTFIARALSAGKHVVTSNKAVVAAHFAEFVSLARENRVAFMIEATVGGGIPWIAGMQKARRIEDISMFSGIMNGTTNFILDAMRKESIDFDVALARAQELGYAERDPSADIDGIDMANKTIISACVAFDVDCVTDFPVTGIRTVSKHDLDLFSAKGYMLKLFGRGVCKDGRYAVAVEPVAIPCESLEAAVPANFNIVSLEGASIGCLKYYGQGAGSLPTGNAIVQDVIDVAEGHGASYDFSRELAYDASLLKGDYVFRTSQEVEGGTNWSQDAWIVRDINAGEARRMLEDIWQSDPAAFMAAMISEV